MAAHLTLLGLLLGLAIAPAAAPPAGAATEPDSAAETVVLLHGLGRTSRSMLGLERELGARGYTVVNLGYPSRSQPVAALADTLAAELARCCEDRTVHFVTHSLGGILVRIYAATYGSHRIGRVVMLSPPNHGSEVVDRLPDDLLRLVMGPASVQLGTGSTGVARHLPAADFELGIITGRSSLNPLFSWWLPGDDDGKVSVASARVDGARDFLVVPYSHTFIMQRDEVIDQVHAFLDDGTFLDRSGG